MNFDYEEMNFNTLESEGDLWSEFRADDFNNSIKPVTNGFTYAYIRNQLKSNVHETDYSKILSQKYLLSIIGNSVSGENMTDEEILPYVRRKLVKFMPK